VTTEANYREIFEDDNSFFIKSNWLRIFCAESVILNVNASLFDDS